MKKAICIFLLFFSFLVFGSQTTNAQGKKSVPLAILDLKAKDSLNGLEVSDYKKVELLVNLQKTPGSELGLTEEAIRTKYEIRLWRAGLEPVEKRETGEFLYLEVNLLSSSYGIAVEFRRPVTFVGKAGTYLGMATTWKDIMFGSHGREGKFVMNNLDGAFEYFLNEYLKVNVSTNK